MSYASFLSQKQIVLEDSGITVEKSALHPKLFEFQRDIVAWALRKGRAALFCDCGLGKTFMQLEWAKRIPGKVLILAPLSVAQQTEREGAKFGIEVRYARKPIDSQITATNYEMLEHFNPSEYQGIVLDESSILKSFEGTFRNQIIESFGKTPFRLACTATPAPNDYMELGNHSEFLGALTRTEMLSTFFVHDGGDTSKWRLKRHAERDFWKWICSWAVMMRKPSDLGYSDEGFTLPPLRFHDVTLDAIKPTEGMLFAMPASTLQERRQARSGSVNERAAEVARIVKSKKREPWLIWCNLNSESEAAARLIPGAVEIRGSDDRERKEQIVRWFIGLECLCGLASNGNTSEIIDEVPRSAETPEDVNCMPLTRSEENTTSKKLRAGERKIQRPSLPIDSESLALPQSSTGQSSRNKKGDAQSVDAKNRRTQNTNGSTLTTAMPPKQSEDYSVHAAISESVNSTTMRLYLNEPHCTCGHRSGERILVSKPSIFGFGLNFQHCPNVVFLGLSDSYEQFYQAVRRCWRFGQKQPVDCYIVTSSNEGAVTENIKRKEKDAARMAEEMVNNMHELNQKEVHGTDARQRPTYQVREESGPNWRMLLGDCVELIHEVETGSIHYSIFSPPFASLYTYSASERDMGNCRGSAEFFQHFAFLTKELHRVMMPGRLLSFHCMNLPMSKQIHGVIGIEDFRGDLIRIFQEAGFVYHSEVVIWKDPVTAMQRTKALGLLHKQLKKDSCMSRQGIPDYLVTLRKRGENPERVTHTNDSFPVQVWQRYASPVWMDINPSDTLQRQSAREHEDERHICPLQLQVIRRALELWTNPNDLVLSPFAGIGSEGYCAVELRRRFLGMELKESYFRQAVANLQSAKPAKLFEPELSIEGKP